MDQNSQNYAEVEIDPSQYIQVIVKRKKTFIAVFLLILAIGFINSLLSPKMYRTSMMIQPPAVGPSLTGANDLETAENLKGLIVNGAFNEELRKRLGLDFDKDHLGFQVVIPSKTNILQISVDLENNKKEFDAKRNDFRTLVLRGTPRLENDFAEKVMHNSLQEALSDTMIIKDGDDIVNFR